MSPGQILRFALAGLTLSGQVHLTWIFVLTALVGSVFAFDIPARQAFLVELVGRDDLMNAIALNSSMVNGARMIGPAIAGLLVAAVGEGWCFFINGVSYLAVLGGLLAMKLEPCSPSLSTCTLPPRARHRRPVSARPSPAPCSARS